MAVPLDVVFRFGKEFDVRNVNPDKVLNSEFKHRLICLLTGKFEVDSSGKCVIPADLSGVGVTRDSVCVGIDFGPISVSYCKDV